MKIRLIILLAAASLAAAGCGSSTSGSGSVTGASTGAAGGSGSNADFPSTPPSGAATGSGAPASGTPSTATLPPATGSGAPQGTPITTKTVHTPDGPYVVKIWAQVNNPSCAGHAYGKAVIAFLKKYPCQRLRRILASTTVDGRPVAIAESATSFGARDGDPYQITGEFTQLEQRDGTGSINDLMREGHRIPGAPPSIPKKEVFKVLSQDNVVTIWDVWYLDGPTDADDLALMKMVDGVFLLL